MDKFDQQILLTVQKWRRPYLTKIFLFLTFSGTGKSWFSFAIVMNVINFIGFQVISNQSQFLRSMFNPFFAWISCSLVKKIVSRNRPSEEINGYIRLVESPGCGSFPSSHAASAFSFYLALEINSHPMAPFVGCWALLVSSSRLYLGVHYLTDILGGIVLGALVTFLLK
jgi:undecaprenyl-diphosphatase